MSADVLSILAGVSSVFGVLTLIGYFYVAFGKNRAFSRSLRELVEGDRLLEGEEIVQLLSGFRSDKERLKALQATLKDSALAREVLHDVKGRSDLAHLGRSQGWDAARILAIASIFFLALAALSVLYAAYAEKPTQGGAQAPEASDFEVYVRDRQLDLSEWQFVPEDKANDKLSKAIWIDKIKVRRMNEDAKVFTIRHASSGAPTPEFTSDTHDVTFRETTELPQGGPRPKLRVFDVFLDVSGEPVGEWFELRLNAVYWNAFNNPAGAWAGIPITQPTKQLIFRITFPAGKPVKTWERRAGSRDTKESDLITDDSGDIKDNRFLMWKIVNPKQNWVYKVTWEW